jgi:hypothetical protein
VSSHRPTILITTAFAVLALALGLAAPAVGAERATPLRAHAVHGEQVDEPESAGFQLAGCVGDPTGDVVTGPDAVPVDSPQADIVRYCVDYSATGLAVSMQVAAPTDPLTDPAWNDFRTAVAFLYETADGTPRIINLGKQRSNGQFDFYVLEGQFLPRLICEGRAVFDGTSYTAGIPFDCLGAGDPLTITSAQMLRDVPDGRVEDGLFDLAAAISVPLETPPDAERITRLAGPSRVETAIAISQASFPSGDADAVLLATADAFPDAVAAAPLATARRAPVLLSSRDDVPRTVRDEILRALGGPGDVTLLGGTAALSDQVAAVLRDDGHRVDRIAGDSRFTTAVAIAEATTSAPEEIYLAAGGSFADALIAGATAASLGGVAVLVDGGGVPAATQTYLDRNPGAPTFAIGTVAARVVADPDSFVTGEPSAMSALLLQLHPRGGEVAVANLEQFPDGLAGGAYAGTRGIPLLLSPRDLLSEGVRAGLEQFGPYSQITFFGGTAALSDATAGQAAAFLE